MEAAAVWIPPNGTEPTSDEEAGLEELLTQAAGTEAAKAILAIYDQLEAAHPAEPCFYLILLGIHAGHHGKGLGLPDGVEPVRQSLSTDKCLRGPVSGPAPAGCSRAVSRRW
ncbi:MULTISPECIES: hypothetical protein [Streptomyces]|uniref:Uncharacterized protein n=1 Tax=Streptomyces changanensis TaxID=2964669 RepID=A0ABY5ND10_9ACTN|nr:MULTISPECIES: hypothetical protein [Streptomyces]UUS33902.1 hypothetical protein NRO40_25785 [Streptomyces changanensis]